MKRKSLLILFVQVFVPGILLTDIAQMANENHRIQNLVQSGVGLVNVSNNYQRR